MDESRWREALDALLAAGESKATIADAIGASWITVHRLSRGGPPRPHRAILRGLVRVAHERGMLAA